MVQMALSFLEVFVAWGELKRKARGVTMEDEIWKTCHAEMRGRRQEEEQERTHRIGQELLAGFCNALDGSVHVSLPRQAVDTAAEGLRHRLGYLHTEKVVQMTYRSYIEAPRRRSYRTQAT